MIYVLIILFVTLLVIALGVVLIINGVRANRRAKAAGGWPSVAGNIVGGELKQRTSTHRDSNGRQRTSITYEPVVQFSYTVNGQTYQSDRMTTGSGRASYDQARAQAILDRYPAGAQVTVYHDPADPENAALEVRSGGGAVPLAAGVVFVILGLIGGCIILLMLLGPLVGSWLGLAI